MDLFDLLLVEPLHDIGAHIYASSPPHTGPLQSMLEKLLEYDDPILRRALNQVELFFSISGDSFSRRGEFASVQELDEKIFAFITEYHRKAKPFR